MRLLKVGRSGFNFAPPCDENKAPPYAILSHVWGRPEDEVQYDDIGTAQIDHLEYFWVDTCCINKRDTSELSEALVSMFRWYQKATKCYVYLSDVSTTVHALATSETSWKQEFRMSRWFTRGWTLQELIAPRTVEFYSKEGGRLGNKLSLVGDLCDLTHIDADVLRGTTSVSDISVDQIFSWASGRQTTREEDKAYSLLGMFGVSMSIIYNETLEKAMFRLREEISKKSALQGRYTPGAVKELLASLKFDEYGARQRSIKAAHARTCKWFLELPSYKRWLEHQGTDNQGSLIWIRGKPGSGKSTLMNFLDCTELEKTTIGAYRSLLVQLLEKVPSLRSVLAAVDFGSTRGPFGEWELEPLKYLLFTAVENLQHQYALCFIDALDECGEAEIRDMVYFLKELCEVATTSDCQIRICFASRHYPNITLQEAESIILENEAGHSEDIERYLSSMLQIGKTTRADMIRREILKRASGVFMWVVLVVELLNKEYDKGRLDKIEKKLEKIPDDLHALFRSIIVRDSTGNDKLEVCLLWVLFAQRPLSAQELVMAILHKVEGTIPSSSDTDTMDMEKIIVDASKGLAEKTKAKNNPTIQFIHESVRDFLLNGGLEDVNPRYATDPVGMSHETLKLQCEKYIAAVNLRHYKPSAKKSRHDHLETRDAIMKNFGLLGYATESILYHSDKAARYAIPQNKFIKEFEFNLSDWIEKYNACERFVARGYGRETRMAYVLADRGYARLIAHHIVGDAYVALDNNCRYKLPLIAALAQGHKEAAISLLRVRVEHAETEHLRQLCKVYAASNDWRGKFKKGVEYTQGNMSLPTIDHANDALLNFIAEANDYPWSRCDRDRCIVAAANRGHQRLTFMFLKEMPGRASEAFTAAASRGHRGLVSAIYSDYRDQLGRFTINHVLDTAHESRHDEMVEHLFGLGIDIRQKDILIPFVARDDQKIVRRLLDLGADINGLPNHAVIIEPGGCVKSFRVSCMRDVTIWYHKPGVVQQRPPNNVNMDKYSPLELACFLGNERMVRLLLDKGARIGQALLVTFLRDLRCASGSCLSIMRILCDHGANPNDAPDRIRNDLKLKVAEAYKTSITPPNEPVSSIRDGYYHVASEKFGPQRF
ncbi:hypothetical protein EJ05DRAFT_509055 [Pseudovirgaria hyperparasitica]|uniref:Uncharacterized protein n=1 Tax=Pseudovirgaria hyperparasitica TaxID=470096 RepID=A0A6A6WFZ2_9PEZI|nr:uncharacterized protein EJ05DRAFT_509055 [Pseudovirgaria hyperparasitica]KAF2760527.1 hypothetical protein EJ05DRAFT_509055 [Pseudovirgaria hyperparasitica]